MRQLPLLLLPGEIDRLLRGVSQALSRFNRDQERSAEIFERLSIKLTEASRRTGYTRAEAAQIIGCTKKTLLKLVRSDGFFLSGDQPTLPIYLVHQLAIPRLTLLTHVFAVDPTATARLVFLSLLELHGLATVASQIAEVMPGDVVAQRLAEWLHLSDDPTATLPVAVTLAHWAALAYRKNPAEQKRFLDLTRRGLFYRTKVKCGALTLLSSGTGQAHFDRAYFLRSEIVILGRNGWAISKTVYDIEPPDVGRLYPQ